MLWELSRWSGNQSHIGLLRTPPNKGGGAPLSRLQICFIGDLTKIHPKKSAVFSGLDIFRMSVLKIPRGLFENGCKKVGSLHYAVKRKMKISAGLHNFFK